jgi:hypothetical protein
MKKVIVLCSITFAFLNVKAKVLTVSNVTGAIAMYKDVQPAIDAASVGDTVFIHASPTTYSGSYSLKKKIVLLGEGTSSVLYAITIDSLAGQTVSGLVINGIQVSYLYNTNKSVKGVTITNSYATSADVDGVSYIIVKNIFTSTVTLGANCIFSNNIVGNYLTNGSNNVISNNIFLVGYTTGASAGSIRSVTNCSVTNNIFLHTTNAVYQGTNNTFSKNMQGGTDLPSGNYSGVVVSPAGAVPSVVFSETGISAGMSNSTYYQYYWSLLPNSPAKNAGTDGKDLGLYGGSYPWASTKTFNGDPGLPKVTLVEVQNAVLAPGGTLKLNIKAKSASTK